MTAVHYAHTYLGLTVTYCPVCHYAANCDGPSADGDTFKVCPSKIGQKCEGCLAEVTAQGDWRGLARPAQNVTRIEVKVWTRGKTPIGTEYHVSYRWKNATTMSGLVVNAQAACALVAFGAAHGVPVSISPDVQALLANALLETLPGGIRKRG